MAREERYVAADRETGRPGCVLIQAALGGDRELLDANFDSTAWEIGRIDRMVPVPEHLIPRWIAAFPDLKATQ